MSRPDEIAGDKLRAIIERIERIEDEIKELSEGKKEIYFEAKGNGFDVKILREVIRIRKQDQKAGRAGVAARPLPASNQRSDTGREGGLSWMGAGVCEKRRHLWHAGCRKRRKSSAERPVTPPL
jgi:uncharacterized protein (UPF0335 family)